MNIEKMKSWFYRPTFFREQQFTLGQAMKFYSLTILVVTLLFSLTCIPRMSRLFHSPEWSHELSIIHGLYPDDLEVTINHGALSTNSDTPVVIPIPVEWADEWMKQERCDETQCDFKNIPLPANLIVIDTQGTVSPESLRAAKTLILFSAHEVGFQNPERGEIRIYNLDRSELRDRFTLTKDVYSFWTDRLSYLIRKLLSILILFLPFLLYIGLWIGHLLYALLGTLIVWFAASIRGHHLTYGRAYLSTLYLFPTPFVAMSVMTLSSIHIPLLFAVILLLAALANFEKRTPLASETLPVKNEDLKTNPEALPKIEKDLDPL